MLQLARTTWESLTADPSFCSELAAWKRKRQAAIRANWIRLSVGIVAALLIGFMLRPDSRASIVGAVLAMLTVLALTWLTIRGRLPRIRIELEGWLIAAMSDRAGLNFREDGFPPPGLTQVEELLFGRIEESRFIGLASASKGSMAGASTYAVLGQVSGRFYRVRRRAAGEGGIVILTHGAGFNQPDRGLWFAPVELEDEMGFSQRFHVHATAPGEAISLLADMQLRERLLKMAGDGEFRAYVDPELAIFFGPDPLQAPRPVSGAGSIESEARLIVERFGIVLETLRELRERLA